MKNVAKLSLAYSVKVTSLAFVISSFCINYSVNGQAQTGTLRDRDGNIYTIKIMPDDKKWMTANLNINIPGSYGYQNEEQKTNQYGRLYTWKSAQEGCKLLGEGWRLPTNEDWQKMAKFYGGVVEDSDDGGKAAYFALINGGITEFNAVYGGRRDADGSYSRVDAHGFYWTGTQSDSDNAWLYNFGKNGKLLNHHPDGQKNTALSVRCVRDSGNSKK
jgi:uncharacterized protein (TIGR02145 family)